jgi:hypothetical protein
MNRLIACALFYCGFLLVAAADAQTLADLKGNWLTREPADSGGTFVTLYTITPATGRLTLRSVGIRLEDSPLGASAGSGTDLLFELAVDNRILTGTLLFRQTLRGLCEMPDLSIPVRGTIADDWKSVELQYDFPRQQYDPCGWDKSMTTPTAVRFLRDK